MNNKKLIDTHAHLIEIKKKSSLAFDEFMSKLESSDYLIDVGISLDDFNERLELHKTYGLQFYTLGLYPSLALGNWENEIEKLHTLLTVQESNPPIALGEMGIDGMKPYGKDQDKMLDAQISLANTKSLPIIIHSRAAVLDCIKVFRKNPPLSGGIMHCYSENPELIPELLELGFYISFAGNITYEKSQIIRNCIKKVPLEKLLVETDSPYLSPEPKRREINTPLNAQITLNFMAQELAIKTDDLYEYIKINFNNLFRLER